MRDRISSLTAAASLGAAVIFLCLACVYFRPLPAARLDNLVYDTWMRLSEKPAIHPAPAIVEIDEASLKKLGQWPWPRVLLGDLVEKILQGGAVAVGLDILLAEPDRSSPASMRADIKSRLGIDIDLDKIPPEYLDNDQGFSRMIMGKPVVLGAFAEFTDASGMPAELPRSTGLAEKTPAGAPCPRDTVTSAKGLLIPMKIFTDAAPIGIINSNVHDDGVVRSVPRLVRAKDNIYAALSLRTLMAAMGKKTLRLDSDMDGLARIQAGQIKAPVGPDGTFRPFYHGPGGTYPSFSAADVLSGAVGANELSGRIVFIGYSATGLLDLRATPMDATMPGVEIHATLVDNMLSGRHIAIPPYTFGLQALAIILSTVLAMAIFGLLPPAGYVPVALAAMAALLWGSWHFFTKGVFISPAYAFLAPMLTGSFLIPARFWCEQAAKRRIKRAFAHYVAPEAVNRIAANGPRALAGENRELSVLFTDVRNFTTISEKMDPGQLVRLLNSYFTPMTACVTAREGTLDKFIGDALMAFWNAPLDVADHQKKAVIAALDMQRRLEKLRPQFVRDFGVEINIGAGIHSGPVQVGNMGSDDLLNYTCIGDNVNLASWLEGLCKRYGAGIVVSRAVMEKCGGIYFRPLDRIRVKGSSRPLEIFMPIDPNSGAEEEYESRWKEALSAYFAGDFATASRMFAGLLEIGDMKTGASLFAERCRQLQAKSPDDWAGVWTYDTK